MSSNSLLEINNVTKTYPFASGGTDRYVLKDLNLTVESGDTLAVVGPSGSGKSTLLNLIGGLDVPTSGSVSFQGQNLNNLDDKALALFRNQEIGFVFQLHHLLPQCTVIENILIPTLPFKKGDQPSDAESRAEALCERVGLSHVMYGFPAQLSGGEQQRTAVVRALINKPKLILADEPTGSLDQSASENLIKLLLELNHEEKTTLIVVTHSGKIASQMNRQLKLENGQLS